MVNIVIPMAGEGRRFQEAGYKKPKPFIDIAGKTMIERVLDNLKMDDAKFILVARDEHIQPEKEVVDKIKSEYNCELLIVDKLTEGAVSTVLVAKHLIDSNEPLLLAGSDQVVDLDFKDFIKDSDNRGLDGSTLTFYADHPKWSYVKVDGNGYIIDVKEKEVISPYANVGIYYYKKGKDFVDCAHEMIKDNFRVNNEFYMALVYNYLIKKGGKVGIYNIKETQMHGLGTPEDLEEYLKVLNLKSKITNSK